MYCFVVIIFHNITVLNFDPINAALLSIRHFFQKYLIILGTPNTVYTCNTAYEKCMQLYMFFVQRVIKGSVFALQHVIMWHILLYVQVKQASFPQLQPLSSSVCHSTNIFRHSNPSCGVDVSCQYKVRTLGPESHYVWLPPTGERGQGNAASRGAKSQAEQPAVAGGVPKHRGTAH